MMKVALLTDGKGTELLKQLQGYGLHVQVGNPEKVESMGENTVDLVYLVPYSWLEDSRWSQLRVTLARSSRYYIVMGKGLRSEQIMRAARDGAYDVIDEEDSADRVLGAIEKAGNSQSLWWQLYGAVAPVGEEILVGRSSLMKSLRESIQRIAPTNATILILGESGTGKERVAEATHKAYGRGKIVAVNCAAIPSELMESELFGVEKGAFTGANQSKAGLVEEAQGGTLFLDEVGELGTSLQPKLLRFLENGVARRVGSTRDYQSDARVISATNRDLKRESDRGRFRMDLYYRLSEVVLNLPPLRRRIEDIPDLAPVFLRQASERMGKNFETLEPELIRKMQDYGWPGNVRELKQVIERIAIHYDGPVMRSEWWDIPGETEDRDQGANSVYQGAWGGTGNFPGTALQTRYGHSRPPFQDAGENRGENTLADPAAGANPAAGYSGLPMNRKQKQELASRLIEESDGELTWVAARIGVHPTTLYRWRKAGKV